jgi:hypothetical protein
MSDSVDLGHSDVELLHISSTEKRHQNFLTRYARSLSEYESVIPQSGLSLVALKMGVQNLPALFGKEDFAIAPCFLYTK